jgi:transcriptional regulator with XRE-family HTH domain
MDDENRWDMPLTPAQTIALRIKEVRRVRGWSAAQLAARCATLGMPELDRSTVANIENGRRQRVGVDELLVLALALGVAPLHLLVPLKERFIAIAPDYATGSGRARQWIRGNHPIVYADRDPTLRQGDRQTYLSQRPDPDEEWTPPPEPTEEDLEQRQRDRMRKWLEWVDLGLGTMTRTPGGAIEFTPTAQTVETLRGDDRGQH